MAGARAAQRARQRRAQPLACGQVARGRAAQGLAGGSGLAAGSAPGGRRRTDTQPGGPGTLLGLGQAAAHARYCKTYVQRSLETLPGSVRTKMGIVLDTRSITAWSLVNILPQ